MTQRSLTFKTFLLSMGSLLQKASSFLLIFFLVRLLDKEHVGMYQQIFYIGAIVYGLFISGISSSLYYFIPRFTLAQEKAAFAWQTIILTFLLGMLSGLAVFLLAPYLGQKLQNPELQEYIQYYAIYIIFWIGSDYFISFLNAFNQHYRSMLFSAAESAANMIVTLSTLYVTQDLKYVFINLAVLGLLRYLVYLFVSFKLAGYPISGFFINPKKQLKYSLPLMMSGWADMVGNYLDKIVVSIFYSPAILAIYAIGTIRLPLWDILVRPVNVVLRVQFAEFIDKKEHAKMYSVWHEAIRKQSLIILPIIMFIWVIAEIAFPVFFTEQYTESVSIFRIYLLDKPIMVISLSVFPLVMGRSDFLLWGSIVYAIANLLLITVLFKPLGLYGPITAVVLAQYVHAGFYVFMITNILGIQFKQLIPLQLLVKVFLANIVPTIAIYSIVKSVANPIVAMGLAFIIYSGIYFILVMRLGLLHKYELKLIFNKILRK